VVGRFAGKVALAAIQATASLTDLAVGFSVGVGAGCSIIVSQYFGAGNDKQVSASVHTAMGIACIGGLAISFLGLAASGPMLTLMGTPADIYAQSLSYVRIYMVAMVFSIIFNMGAALQRAVGDTRTPSIIVAATCLVNVVLDLVLVAWAGLGVFGAALSTACSLAVGAIVTIVVLSHAKGPWHLYLRRIRIDVHLASDMLKCGLPLGLQSSAYSVSNIILQSSINSFGSDAIAAWGLACRLDAVVWLVSDALGTSVTTFAAQNFGADERKRMRKGLHTSLILTAVVIGGISVALLTLATPLASLFVTDDQVISMTTKMLVLISPFYIFYSLMDNVSGTIRGTGESLRPMLLTVLGTCVFRIIWLFAFVPAHHSIEVALTSYPVTWLLTGILMLIYYRHGHWAERSKAREKARLASHATA
jgi:putative MATE family efflux protein